MDYRTPSYSLGKQCPASEWHRARADGQTDVSGQRIQYEKRGTSMLEIHIVTQCFTTIDDSHPVIGRSLFGLCPVLPARENYRARQHEATI